MLGTSKGNTVLSRLKPLFHLQKLKHSFGEKGGGDQIYNQVGSDSAMEQGATDMSKWRKLDSRTLGIARKSIPESSWIVLNVLQRAGFESYLVGGCVRDLLLKKVPKDFDIVTTAALKQIKKEFHRCMIVGSRFPICRVHIKGTVVEVSSFDTVAKDGKEKDLLTEVPHGCDRKDYVRWKNSMHRDFTVNSLFFNPLENKIYDYANAMMDLRSLKLQTLIPALQSFKEDSARILRGLRLAARLGLSLSKETEVAIQKLVPSIASLPKARIMLEMNYMLSYGASRPSIFLLKKYKLLDMLLPLHAAYLGQQAENSRSFAMLMELFCNLDKLFTCDQPSDSMLWVGLLGFHLALVLNPQDALVLWTFASVLYHGNWTEGVKYGREHAHGSTVFIPEMTEAHHKMSIDELAEKVTQLASAVQYCICGLSNPDALAKLMTRFPHLPSSDMIFVPKATQIRASCIFKVLEHEVQSYARERKCLNINFNLLGQGDLCETRFVVGKIILDTLSTVSVQRSGEAEDRRVSIGSDSENKITVSGSKNRKSGMPPHSTEPQKSAEKKKLNFVSCDISEDRPESIRSDSGDEIKVSGKGKRKRVLPPDITEPQKGARRQKLNFVKCDISEEGSIMEINKNVDTEFRKAANLKQKVVEKEKETILSKLKTVNDNKHLEIKNEEPRQRNETKLKSVKKNVQKLPESKDVEPRAESETKLKSIKNSAKKINHSSEKTNTPLVGNKVEEKVSEKNGGGKGKTEKPKLPSLSSMFRQYK